SAFSLFEREQPLLHSDALIKNRWTHSEWSLINAEWYYLLMRNGIIAYLPIKNLAAARFFIGQDKNHI
ncbi:hypothetical protein L2703_18650, partial [Shewanella basaltis]|uniref:hypothetical protein n=1 Tax=Shewanella basaltis TaxID=472183 RepID=UPI00200F515D